MSISPRPCLHLILTSRRRDSWWRAAAAGRCRTWPRPRRRGRAGAWIVATFWQREERQPAAGLGSASGNCENHLIIYTSYIIRFIKKKIFRYTEKYFIPQKTYWAHSDRGRIHNQQLDCDLQLELGYTVSSTLLSDEVDTQCSARHTHYILAVYTDSNHCDYYRLLRGWWWWPGDHIPVNVYKQWVLVSSNQDGRPAARSAAAARLRWRLSLPHHHQPPRPHRPAARP